MPFQKGREKTGGRKPGQLNKTSKTARENIVAVFDEIGGVRAMAKWAGDNPTEFYKIYRGMLPVEEGAPGSKSNPIQGETVLRWATEK